MKKEYYSESNILFIGWASTSLLNVILEKAVMANQWRWPREALKLIKA